MKTDLSPPKKSEMVTGIANSMKTTNIAKAIGKDHVCTL